MIRAGAENPIVDLFPPEDGCITPESEARRPGPAAAAEPRAPGEPRRRLAARRPHRRPTSWPPGCSSAPRRCSTSPARPTATQTALRPGRAGHRGLRPQLPDRPPAARARRPLRAGLERRRQRLPAPQLGLARGPRPRPRRHGREHGPARRRPAQGPEGARPARRHARHLDHRVRPDAVQPGRQGPRPQPVHASPPGWPAAASRAASPTAPATSGRTRRSSTRPTATTSTPRSCTCSASTTRS